MGHSYVNCLLHVVFSVKNRERCLGPDIRERLFPYIAGVARNKEMKAIAVGGVDDHVQVLLSIPSTMSPAHAVGQIKALSSKWIHETFPEMRDFAWQTGYGAFSLGLSQIQKTISYINNQEEHHRRKTFQEEFVAFLKAHGIDYDERYVWG